MRNTVITWLLAMLAYGKHVFSTCEPLKVSVIVYLGPCSQSGMGINSTELRSTIFQEVLCFNSDVHYLDIRYSVSA